MSVTLKLALGALLSALIIWGGVAVVERQRGSGKEVVRYQSDPQIVPQEQKDIPFKDIFDSASSSSVYPAGFTDKYGFRIFYTQKDSECSSPGLSEEKVVAMAGKAGLRKPDSSGYLSYWELSIKKLKKPDPLHQPPLACAWVVANYESGSDYGVSFFNDVVILDVPQKEYERIKKVDCALKDTPGLAGFGTTYCAPQGMLALFLSANPPRSTPTE
ncbi:hypothetical protein EXS62_01945 [Candidatus Kaiserbacteria bacterium]|nr:hypothetical protein [Candidatus Kaiserbacteria bacterium]